MNELKNVHVVYEFQGTVKRIVNDVLINIPSAESSVTNISEGIPLSIMRPLLPSEHNYRALDRSYSAESMTAHANIDAACEELNRRFKMKHSQDGDTTPDTLQDMAESDGITLNQNQVYILVKLYVQLPKRKVTK